MNFLQLNSPPPPASSVSHLRLCHRLALWPPNLSASTIMVAALPSLTSSSSAAYAPLTTRTRRAPIVFLELATCRVTAFNTPPITASATAFSRHCQHLSRSTILTAPPLPTGPAVSSPICDRVAGSAPEDFYRVACFSVLPSESHLSTPPLVCHHATTDLDLCQIGSRSIKI